MSLAFNRSTEKVRVCRDRQNGYGGALIIGDSRGRGMWMSFASFFELYSGFDILKNKKEKQYRRLIDDNLYFILYCMLDGMPLSS